eukprot:CAMPEP_0179485046 /NCGR_PEP_ID=MMETSP0799-20121207/61800_1 /TAXON_ID=46947 /ORGANISM="Geminigera cryophila, Strain CCMP2564" /LENGTH=254 /DNA_ID=CAMNT_0021299313 /DNA_START=57 /DNA_END=820 /DNA_ORIENTATION=-
MPFFTRRAGRSQQSTMPSVSYQPPSEIRQTEFAISATVGHVSGDTHQKASDSKATKKTKARRFDPFAYRFEDPLRDLLEIPLSPSTDQTVLTSAEPRTHPDANTNAKISANTKYPNIPRLIALAPGRSDEDFSGHATRHASASTSAAVSGTSSTVPSQQASTHPSPRHHYHFNHTVSLETKNVYSAETGATVSSQKCVAGSAGQRAHLSLGSQNQISSRCDLIPASQYQNQVGWDTALSDEIGPVPKFIASMFS